MALYLSIFGIIALIVIVFAIVQNANQQSGRKERLLQEQNDLLRAIKEQKEGNA